MPSCQPERRCHPFETQGKPERSCHPFETQGKPERSCHPERSEGSRATAVSAVLRTASGTSTAKQHQTLVIAASKKGTDLHELRK